MKTIIKIFLLLQFITCNTVYAQTISSCVKARNLWKYYDYDNAKKAIDDCIKNNFKNSSNWYIRGIIYFNCFKNQIDSSINKKGWLEQSIVSYFNVLTLEIDGKLYTRLSDFEIIKEKIFENLYAKKNINNIEYINDIFFDKFLQIENEIRGNDNYDDARKLIDFARKKTLVIEYCSRFLKSKLNKDYTKEVLTNQVEWLYETDENGDIKVIRDGLFVKIYNKTGSDIKYLEIDNKNIGLFKNNTETEFIQFDKIIFDSGYPRPKIKGFIETIEVNQGNYWRCGSSLMDIKFGTFEYDLVKTTVSNDIVIHLVTHKK